MKYVLPLLFLITLFAACGGKSVYLNDTELASPEQLKGTWKLIQATLIEKGDTTVTDYTKDVSFIKIINDTHFAFLQHDLNKGKDSSAVFVAGGGQYSLQDSLYKENLEYCSARDWEGNDFEFVINLRNDTLTQRGIEKVAAAGVDRVNIEKYVRVVK